MVLVILGKATEVGVNGRRVDSTNQRRKRANNGIRRRQGMGVDVIVIKLEGLGGTWGSGWVRDRKEVGRSWRGDLKVGGGGVERDGDKSDERVRGMKEAVCVVLVP